jgi:hypothetical protein
MRKNKCDSELDDALKHEMENLLDPSLKELGMAMLARLEFHRQLILRHHRDYYWAGVFFRLAIPIGAALVTFTTIEMFPVVLGLALTILTIVNSVLRPAEEFISSSHMLVRLHDWEMSLAVALRNNKENVDELYGLLQIKDQELSKMGDALADSVFSQTLPNPRGRRPELGAAEGS